MKKAEGQIHLTCTGGMIDTEGENIPIFLRMAFNEVMEKVKLDEKESTAVSLAIYWEVMKFYVIIARLCNLSSLNETSVKELIDLQSNAAALYVLFDSVCQRKLPPYVFKVMVITVIALLEQKKYCAKGNFGIVF